jgi:hypothetical protein
VPQRLGTALDLPEEQAELHHRSDLVQAELELGDHAEVAAAAAERPEQIRVLGCRSARDPPVGHDDLRGLEVVDAQPGLPGQPAHPAAQRQAGDPGVADGPERYRQVARLGRGVDVGEQGPGLDPGPPGQRIDRHRPHPAEVDHQAVVDGRSAGDVVRAGADRDLQALRLRIGDGRDDVGRRRAELHGVAAPIGSGGSAATRLATVSGCLG